MKRLQQEKRNDRNKRSDPSFKKENFFHIEMYERYFTNFRREWKAKSDFHFTLDENDSQMEFAPLEEKNGVDELCKTVHQGQRKLLLGELYFFISTYELWKMHKEITVVYIGAASGSHLMMLWDLLMGYDATKFEWHLYDKAKFSPHVLNVAIDLGNKVTVFNEYFTEETVKRYEGKTTMLISDIRSLSASNVIKRTNTGASREEVEALDKLVDDDNKLNKAIYLLLKPICASIKFRMPFYVNEFSMRTFNFMKGVIVFQAWAKLQSAETRLIVTENVFVDYDCLKYERQLAYHNTVVRKWLFKMKGKAYRSYCPCWDCTYEARCFVMFYKMFYPEANYNEIYRDETQLTDWVLKKRLYEVRRANPNVSERKKSSKRRGDNEKKHSDGEEKRSDENQNFEKSEKSEKLTNKYRKEKNNEKNFLNNQAIERSKTRLANHHNAAKHIAKHKHQRRKSS